MRITTLLFLSVLITISGLTRANEIVFLGDDARLQLLASCKECKDFNLALATPEKGASASEVANVCQNARHAIIVVDAASGPLQITREHILIARQAGVPSLSIMFVNIALFDGIQDVSELIKQEEIEVRQLMEKYEMGGANALVFQDSDIQYTKKLESNGIGLDSLLKIVTALPERKARDIGTFSGKKFFAFVYLLSTQESIAVSTLEENSLIEGWINGQTFRAHVRSKKPLQPGGLDDLSFEAEQPIVAPIGSRLFLKKDGKIIAAGVLKGGS